MTGRLADVPAGTRVRLVAVDADRRTVRRLAELGFTPGVEFSVLQAAGGPSLLAVRGSRVALDRSMARRIRVAGLEEA